MITPSYAITATERVLPKLALDFTTASLDSRVTFTRALNTATVVNSSGTIIGVNADVPRFDYDPIALTCKGLLIEEARTNIIYDSVFSTIGTTSVNNAWFETLAELDTTVNYATSPAGTQTAALLSINTSTAAKYIQYRTANTTAGTYTYSVFAKPNSTDTKVTMLLGGEIALTNFVRCYFDLSGNGTATFQAATGTAVQASSPTITKFANGWYRCTIQVTLTAPSSITALLYPGLYSGQTTASQTLVWGAQVELGAFATSYIPTTTTALTRNADVATMTGTNFSSWFNATQGAFSVRCSQYANKYLLQVDDGTANNCIQLSCGGTNAYEYYTVVSGAATNAFSGSSLPAAQNTMTTITATYKASSNNAGIAGQLPFANQTGAIPSGLTTLRFASNQASGQQGSCTIQRVFYYPQRLINAEIQAFSKG